MTLGIAALLALVGACIAEAINLRRGPRPSRVSAASRLVFPSSRLVVTRYGWVIPVARVLVGVGVAVVASATGVVAGVAGAFVCAFAVCLGLATAIDRLRPATGHVGPTIGRVRAAVPVPRGVPDPDQMAWMGMELYDPDIETATRPLIDLTDERPGYGADIELEQTAVVRQPARRDDR